MLDLDHLQTPHVFAAAKQIDLIMDFCKRISLSVAEGRRFDLEVIRPAFVALRWLAVQRFADMPKILDGIDELERQAEQLANLPLQFPDPGWPVTKCPACGHPPTATSHYDRNSYCSDCFEVIMPGLERVRSCEEGFGTDAI